MAIRVPNTNTFSLQNVVDAVEDHAGNIAAFKSPTDKKDLQDCFDQALNGYFNPLYDNISYAPANSMKRFRDYGPQTGPCGSSNQYNGGYVWPFIKYIDLGSGTGVVDLVYDTYSLPDRILVYWDGILQIDTGFRGNVTSYDYGYPDRSEFTSALSGRQDPVIGFPYPNLTYWPDDGYPRVYAHTSKSFNKTKASPSTAEVRVYGPMSTTIWEFYLTCL